MMGIVPSASETFEVLGYVGDANPIDGKIYVNKSDGRLYYYTINATRSNPSTGYFPIWNGKEFIETSFSNTKYLDKDVTLVDLESISSKVDNEVAQKILYDRKRCENNEILAPSIAEGDNMFTQCVKGALNAKKITAIDLLDLVDNKLDDKIVIGYYNALQKITFMRLDRWNVWIDIILQLSYVLKVYKDEKLLLQYKHPENVFETGIVNYDTIIKSKDDSFKKILKILIILENITKSSLRSPELDDYTINNMLTTLNSNKPISAQLFSRFIRMANLNYEILLYDNGQLIFEYRE